MNKVLSKEVAEIVGEVTKMIVSEEITENVCIITNTEFADVKVDGNTIYVRNVNNPESFRGMKFKHYVVGARVDVESTFLNQILMPCMVTYNHTPVTLYSEIRHKSILKHFLINSIKSSREPIKTFNHFMPLVLIDKPNTSFSDIGVEFCSTITKSLTDFFINNEEGNESMHYTYDEFIFYIKEQFCKESSKPFILLLDPFNYANLYSTDKLKVFDEFKINYEVIYDLDKSIIVDLTKINIQQYLRYKSHLLYYNFDNKKLYKTASLKSEMSIILDPSFIFSYLKK